MWLAWTEVCSKWKIHTRSQRLGSKRRYFKHFFSFWPGRHAGSLFPDQGLICAPCNWKHGVLTTRPPEKSKKNYFNYLINFYIGYMLKWYFRYIGLANILKSIAVVSFYLFYWPAYRELMATHCSILAWRIPWAEEPGGLQSTGSQGVGHDWATSLALSFTFREFKHVWLALYFYWCCYSPSHHKNSIPENPYWVN